MAGRSELRTDTSPYGDFSDAFSGDAELGADLFQRRLAGGDTIDDGTITRLNLRGVCG